MGNWTCPSTRGAPFWKRSMPRLALTADLHLSPWIWQRVKGSHGIPGRAFKALMEDIRGAGVDATLVAGDVLDASRPDSGSVAMLEKTGNMYAVMGNHDYSLPPWHELAGVKSLYPDKPTNIGGVSVCGVDASRDASILEGEIARVPPCDILVLHTAFRHLLGFDGAWQLDLADMEPPYPAPIILVGDIHTRNITRVPGKPVVASPGSLYPRDIEAVPYPDDANEAFGWLLWEDGKFEERHLPPFVIKVNGLEDAREAVKQYSDILLCVRCPQEEKGAVMEIAKDNRHLDVAFFPTVSSIMGMEFTVETGASVGGLVDALPLVVDRAKEPDVFNKLMEDLKSA